MLEYKNLFLRIDYLATISVKPKESLPAGTHTDVLVLSGTNQGVPFTHNIPLTFIVNKATRDFVALQAINEIYSPTLMLGSLSLPDGYKWRLENTATSLIPIK
ncbi:MAG: hypothetical protein FWE57_03085 [Chitinispirillia bacterium]|nr:hypothetical protein [Chitinispirillia bacterium]